jgi:hypothetical protein
LDTWTSARQKQACVFNLDAQQYLIDGRTDGSRDVTLESIKTTDGLNAVMGVAQPTSILSILSSWATGQELI